MQHKILQNRRYYHNRIQAVLKELNIREGSVLDLGCGEMLIKPYLNSNNIRYIGIDQFPFQEEEDFYCADILNYPLENETYDFIFLLGVLDHMNFSDQIRILQKIQNRFQKTLVVSRWNCSNLILRMFYYKRKCVDIESHFKGYRLKRLAFVKFPRLKFLWKPGEDKFWYKFMATEYVYIIQPVAL